LGFRVQNDVKVLSSGFGDEVAVTGHVVRVNDEPEDASLARRDQIEHLKVIVTADPHEKTKGLQPSTQPMWAGQLNQVRSHSQALLPGAIP